MRELIIVVVLIAIVGSLGQALFAMSSGHGDPQKMVRSLTIRVGLSVLLFGALMLAWHLGWIQPHQGSH
jgi:hypothetical protein